MPVPTIQGALLCDAARVYENKVSILGGFVSALHVPSLPIAAPVWFAGRVAFSAEELASEHAMVVAATSPKNEPLGDC